MCIISNGLRNNGSIPSPNLHDARLQEEYIKKLAKDRAAETDHLRRFLDKTKDSIEITSINGEFYNLVEIRQTVNEYYYKFVPNFGKEIIYSSKVPIPGYQIGKSYILGFFPK